MKSQADRQTSDRSDHHASSGARRRPRKKKGSWILVLFVIVMLGASGYAAWHFKGSKSEVSTEGGTITAQRGSLMVTVTESGSIRAHKSIQYKCQVERKDGEVTILELVPAGTYITQQDVDNGMILAKLDASRLEDRLVQEQMELSNEKQSATAAKEAYDIQVITNESNVAKDELSLRFGLLDLQKYLGAELANELVKDANAITDLTAHVAPIIAQAKADPDILTGSESGQMYKSNTDNIVLAQGNLKNAQATLIGTEKLHDANYVSDLDLDQDRLMVVNRQFQDEDANVNLNLFLEYEFPKEAERLLSDYIEAGRELQRTHARCRSELAQAQATLTNAELRYTHQDDRVGELVEQIGFCTIRAKAPGLVIWGSGGTGDMFRGMRGRGMIAEGETVWEGQTIISMPDTAEMVAEVGVHEAEVDKVRPGQPAEVVMDAFPDRVLQGEVLEIAPLPDQERGFLNPDLKLYKTLVKIEGRHDYLKTRMSCRVQILIQNLEDVITVPIQVVANRTGRKVCYVQTRNGPEEREVRTGAFNDTFTEIVEGLEPGDEVLLNPPMFTEGVSEGGDADKNRFGGRKAPEAGKETPKPQGNVKPTPGPAAAKTPGGGSIPGGAPDIDNLTDEQIDKVLGMVKMMDQAKAEELEKLRKSDPEGFKKKLKEFGEEMKKRFQQGGGPGGPGRGGPGRGGPGGGRPRGGGPGGPGPRNN